MPKRLLQIVAAILCARTAAAQWTDLTPPADALVYYVSTSGSDSAPGSEAAPFRTLARGYQALRDGHPDQLRLKAGDTWNESFPSTWSKGSGSAKSYMVIASYGAGPRPRIRVTSPVIYGGNAGKTGLAIVDLDVKPVAPGSGYAAFTFFQPWTHLLIEGCSIVGFPVNIVIQETGAGRINDVKIRRCLIADSYETGSGHSQGFFGGSIDNLVIEECILDSNARNKADMFCHNVYIHETCGPCIFRGNITVRACSHGVQQRPGGDMTDNLAADCPIDLFQGDGAGILNVFARNVALDSRDINAIDTRGLGFVVYGNTAIDQNIAAYQTQGTGWGAVYGFDLICPTIRSFTHNAVWSWNSPGAHAGQGYSFETAAAFTGPTSPNFIGATQIPYGGALPPAGWVSTIAADPHASMADYMASLGRTGGLAEFMVEARLQQRGYWRNEFTAPVVTAWVRSRFGIGPAPCYADQDGDGHLTPNDFQAFLNNFAAAAPASNCDGSTASPALNANDFQCFMNAYAAGCP